MKRFFYILAGIVFLWGILACSEQVSVPTFAYTARIGAFEGMSHEIPNSENQVANPIVNYKGALYINEIKAGGSDKKLKGWIELYNNSNFSINLMGYYLSDNPDNLKCWKFPDASIGPGELLLVWAPNDPHEFSNKGLHTNFKIPPQRGTLILTQPDGVTVIDKLSYEAELFSASYGRYPDSGSNYKFFYKPTPGSSNNNIDLTHAPGRPDLAITWDDDSIDAWYDLLSFTWYSDIRTTFCLTQPYRLTEDKWGKLLELKQHGHEIACHGYTHVNALEYIKQYGLEAYINDEITRPVEIMALKGLPPISFAYPFGVRSPATDSALLNYFIVVRTTSYSPDGNPFTWGTTRVVPANGMDINYSYSEEDYFNWLERAKNNNQVVVLYGHTPTSSLANDYQTPHTRLESIINKAKELNLTFYTLSDLSADIGTLTVELSTRNSHKPEWTVDRKTWYPSGSSITLPAGEYTVMSRNTISSFSKQVIIEKNKIQTLIIAE